MRGCLKKEPDSFQSFRDREKGLKQKFINAEDDLYERRGNYDKNEARYRKTLDNLSDLTHKGGWAKSVFDKYTNVTPSPELIDVYSKKVTTFDKAFGKDFDAIPKSLREFSWIGYKRR